MDGYKRIRYDFVISENCKKEDGFYHITVNNWMWEIQELVCPTNKATAEELVPRWDAPKYLVGVDIYQFTSIGITEKDEIY